MGEHAFINPFSIAARESEQASENEVTAEGFFKNPDDPKHALGKTLRSREEDVNALALPPKAVKSNVESRVSPFDVLQQ